MYIFRYIVKLCPEVHLRVKHVAAHPNAAVIFATALFLHLTGFTLVQ